MEASQLEIKKEAQSDKVSCMFKLLQHHKCRHLYPVVVLNKKEDISETQWKQFQK